MSEKFGRRSFLGAAAAAAAAAAAPLAARALALAPGHYAARSGAEPLREPQLHGESAEAEGEWHIDDMWGHAPRYAHPIPHSPMRSSPIAWEHVDPIDRFLVI